jgi:putative endonuclease
MHTVYVLISLKDKKFYVGLTSNLTRRIKEHTDGKNPSTRSRRPLELIYHEVHSNKQDAARREQYFKTSKGKHSLRQMVTHRLNELKIDFVNI